VNDLERMLRWLISDSSARLMAAAKAQQRFANIIFGPESL